MRVDEALSQVRVLQAQVARASDFCCYRAATVAASGLAAWVAALVQSYWLPRPVEQLSRYLFLWVSVALVSVLVTGAEILSRWWRTDSHHVRRQTVLATRQFLPCLVVGAVVTWAVAAYGAEHAVLLPGFWSLVFSLGIFASSPYLPRGAVLVAAYYLVAGLVCLRWGQDQQSLAPWTMVISFGVGQLLTALVLLRRREAE